MSMTAHTQAGPSRRQLVGNFLSLAGAETASKLVTMAAFAYVARVAGPDGLGYIEFAAAVLLCAGLVVEQGFGPYGAREIAHAPQRTAELVSEIVAARAVLAAVAYVAVVAFALAFDRPPVLTRLLLVYGMSLLAMPLLLPWVFQGHDAMRVVATAQVVRQTVFAAVIFLCVRGPAQIWLVAVAELAGVCSAVAYGLRAYRRRFRQAPRIRFRVSGHLFREGVPIGLSQMFWVVRMSGATLMLGVIATPAEVGYFAAALRIFIALHTFVWLYFFNLLPSLARAWALADGGFAGLLARSLHATAWIGLVAGLLWVRGAGGRDRRVREAFLPAAAPLQWLAAVCTVAALSGTIASDSSPPDGRPRRWRPRRSARPSPRSACRSATGPAGRRVRRSGCSPRRSPSGAPLGGAPAGPPACALTCGCCRRRWRRRQAPRRSSGRPEWRRVVPAPPPP
jgi:PST family polysaccharide transporter